MRENNRGCFRMAGIGGGDCSRVLKWVKWLVWMTIGCGIFTYMQLYHSFHFPFIEQQQMFLCDGGYIFGKLAEPAGFVTLIKEFCLSFFILPYCGATFVTLMLMLAALLTRCVAISIDPSMRILPLVALWPIATQTTLLLNFDYQYSGIIAYTLVVAVLAIYIAWRERITAPLYKIVSATTAIALVLYWLVGGGALWFALAVAAYEIIRAPRYTIQALVPAAATVALGVMSVYTFNLFGELRIALSADGYYNRVMHPEWEIHLVWIGLPAIIALATWTRNLKAATTMRSMAEWGLQIAMVAMVAWWMADRQQYYLQDDTVRFQELDYYERNQQWDKIIERCGTEKISNNLHLVMLNTALIERDLLAEQAFAYRQNGIKGISLDWSDNNPFIFPLLSELHYALGNPSIAQEVAFKKNSESIAINESNNPRALMRLVETGLIYGMPSGYAVAEKYLSLLEKSLFYRKWASLHCPLLYNDAAVEADSRLGEERRNMTNIDLAYALEENPDLVKQFTESSFARRTVEHICMGYLLNMDLPRYYEIVKRSYGTPLMPTLPKAFQEALLIHATQDKSVEGEYNIPQQMKKQFIDFQSFVARNYNRKDLAAIMRSTYGNTYWYYYMFTKI